MGWCGYFSRKSWRKSNEEDDDDVIVSDDVCVEALVEQVIVEAFAAAETNMLDIDPVDDNSIVSQRSALRKMVLGTERKVDMILVMEYYQETRREMSTKYCSGE